MKPSETSAEKTITITQEANELVQVEVGFLSVVDRGANRVPFKVIKRDPREGDGMNTFLSRLMSRATQKVETKLAGFLVAKNDRQEARKGALKEAGFSVEDEREVEGAAFYAQDNWDGTGESFVLKISDELGAVIAGTTVQKFFTSFGESTDFSDNLAQSGFMPGVGLAFDALRDSVFNILDEARSPEDATSMVTKAVEEFGGFVVELAEQLPTTAFKAENLKLEPKAPAKKAEEKPEPTETPAKTKKAESEDEPAEGTESVEGEEDKGQVAVLKAIGGLSDQLGSMRGDIEALQKDVGKANESAEAAVTAVSKQAEVLREAVGGTDNGDPEPSRKSDGSSPGTVAYIDTARKEDRPSTQKQRRA